MCGIVGCLGSAPALPILFNGLRKLEYRGYDSAGLALNIDHHLKAWKQAGKVADLEEHARFLYKDPLWSRATSGIAHTRWATHGEPNKENAHPHLSNDGHIAVVHNGIIDNYRELRESLLQKADHTFHSDTDTEILAHLIGSCYQDSLLKAVQNACRQVKGTFGLCCMASQEPGVMVVARRGSPIAIGIGEDNIVVASDPISIVAHTTKVVYLEDNDIVYLDSSGKTEIHSMDGYKVDRKLENIDWLSGGAERGNYDHFMIKEINDQPGAMRNTIRGRLNHDEGTAYLSGLRMDPVDLANVSDLKIVACGTSLYAGLLGKYILEDMAGIPTEVKQAADFSDHPLANNRTLVLAVSQSGETADTLGAIREAKQRNLKVAAIVNSEGSTLARECGRGVYIHAGPEISVASTKAFGCQAITLLMLALKFARARHINREQGQEMLEHIEHIPNLIEQVIANQQSIINMATVLTQYSNAILIGRGFYYPVAMEGALKIKEVSYIHAEGYHSAELKHGPLALLGKDMPVIVPIHTRAQHHKMITAINECRSRGSPILGIINQNDNEARSHMAQVVEIPVAPPIISAFVATTVLQLIAYHTARLRECPIDQPRHLAKSVTVE